MGNVKRKLSLFLHTTSVAVANLETMKERYFLFIDLNTWSVRNDQHRHQSWRCTNAKTKPKLPIWKHTNYLVWNCRQTCVETCPWFKEIPLRFIYYKIIMTVLKASFQTEFLIHDVKERKILIFIQCIKECSNSLIPPMYRCLQMASIFYDKYQQALRARKFSSLFPPKRYVFQSCRLIRTLSKSL